MLEKWNFEEKGEFDKQFGCGYPGDEITRMWLQRNHDKTFGFPSVVRFSWKTFTAFHQQNGRKYKPHTSIVEIDVDDLK